MKRTRTYRGPAKGFEASGNRKVCVAFEPDQFDRINTHAKEANLTFAEAVRSLVCFAFDRLDTEAVADAKQAAFRAEAKEFADVCPTCKGEKQITVFRHNDNSEIMIDRLGFANVTSFGIATTVPCPDCTAAQPPGAPGGA